MTIRIGTNPIAWSNDDLPELGGDIKLETCLAEARQAGYLGAPQGLPPERALRKLPSHYGARPSRDPAALSTTGPSGTQTPARVLYFSFRVLLQRGSLYMSFETSVFPGEECALATAQLFEPARQS